MRFSSYRGQGKGAGNGNKQKNSDVQTQLQSGHLTCYERSSSVLSAQQRKIETVSTVKPLRDNKEIKRVGGRLNRALVPYKHETHCAPFTKPLDILTRHIRAHGSCYNGSKITKRFWII